MKQEKTITILVICIAIVAAIASSMGVFTNDGVGVYAYQSIRGETIQIYGKGIYKHMSADVAPQGIAQDYVTLFIGVPLLLIALMWAKKGSLKGWFLLAGVLGYFFLTYLFYLVMGMYNYLFLAYTFLMGTTFFALTMTLLSFDLETLPFLFSEKTPTKFAGIFLIFNAFAIASLWLSVVVPPLLDGSIIPKDVAHYTTLIVQGMDLGLLLPLSLVSGWLLIKRTPFGYLMGTTYLIFLSLLMTALCAKIIAMGLLGSNIFPVIFIIPTFMFVAVISATLLLKNIFDNGLNPIKKVETKTR
jgi:hypothetical protein